MAITPALIYADLASSRASGGFVFGGINFDRLALAIGSALPQWFLSNGVVLSGVVVGTAGSGTINTLASRLVLLPAAPLVIGGLNSAGMVGPLSVSLGSVVAQGLAKTVSLYGQYTGIVNGVGVGADISRVVSVNPPALTSLLLSSMATILGPGSASAQMALGLGTGISSLFQTITGTGNVVGSPSIAAASGTSISRMV